ncbi:MFS transporter [Kiloniella majae]|uniref:MFS transporter n=1 Tax=Kiloniella majae TaxID=1938558 RepID=UPI000F77B1BD|nr:MFS transporter [Kiloniella majae]
MKTRRTEFRTENNEMMSRAEKPLAVETAPEKTPLNSQAYLILLLLFIGVFCNGMIVPFMGFFIIDELGRDPWEISIYVGLVSVLTLLMNRQFGERFDKGARVRPLIATSSFAFLTATTTLSLYPSYWVIVGFISICFSFSNASTSLMYSFGRAYAEKQGMAITAYNSYLRSMTSLGWMMAPALSFFLAGQWGNSFVFYTAASLAVLWVILWFFVVPTDFTAAAKEPSSQQASSQSRSLNHGLYLASAACLFIAGAHILTSAALPLYFTQEAKLPTYAPGLAFAIKCLTEVAVILLIPYAMQKYSPRTALYAATLIAMPTFYILSQVDSLPQLVVGAALEGLYYGIFAGVSITFVQSFANGRLGRATSLYMNSLFLGGMLGNVSMGLIASAYSYQTAIQLSLIIITVALVVLIASRRSDQAVESGLSV